VKEIDGFSIRRKTLMNLEENHGDLFREFKTKVFHQYNKQIREPL